MNQFRRPLVVALLSFLTGLLPALRFQIPVLVPLAGFACLLFIVVGIRTRTSIRGPADDWVLLLLLATSGGVAGTLARIDAAHDCRARFTDDMPVQARGVLGAAHRAGAAGAGSPRLPVQLERMEGWPGCTGELRMRMPPGEPDLPPGSVLSISGRWRQYSGVEGPSPWPADPRYHGFIIADSVAAEPAAADAGSFWLRVRARADARMAELFPDHQPMVEGLLLGRREYMDPEMVDRFARAGLSHLLAISGTHVGLLAAALLLIGSVLRLPRRRAIYLTLVATWGYLALIGAEPSAVRSGVMLSLGLLAFILQRPSASLAIMAFAALAILGQDPLTILNAGFQLSFAGVLSILLLRGPMLQLVPRRLLVNSPFRAPIEGTVISVAAFIFTAPIVAHHFGMVAPISMLANLPAIPLSSLALIGGASALLAQPIVPGIASLLADGTSVVLDLFDLTATLAIAVPYGHGPVGPPPWWSWLAASATGVIIAHSGSGGTRHLRRIWGVGAAAVTLVVWPLLPGPAGKGLEIHFIDVGQGDAIALRTPGDRWVLVDGGPATDDYDAGERRVVPFLRSRGARRLEAIIVTHPDMDHIGGVAAVMRAFPVAHVFEPGLAVGRGSYLDFLSEVERGNTRWLAARSGRTVNLDGVTFDFLWPDPQTVDAPADPNQISAIVRVTYDDFDLLLTGDAGTEVEELLVSRHGDRIASEVLKLGHHGSQTSTSESLLAAVSPELAVVSAGRRNRYGHPASSVLARVRQHDVPVARTDREGTVSIRVAPGGHWSREEW